MKTKNTDIQTIHVTLAEIRMATRPNVYRSKKQYTRKKKHKNAE